LRGTGESGLLDSFGSDSTGRLITIPGKGTTVGMSGQIARLEAPRSLVKFGGSQALVECATGTRSVGRTAMNSEAFWFTTWDWDTQVIWATVRGFFDAYNMGRYDECLAYVSEIGSEKDADVVIDLLKRAKAFSEEVSVEAITDLMIAGSRASGAVNQIVRSNTTKQNMSFVKERGSWRISWPILWNDNGFLTRD
jgi:hypothetical protein